MPGVLGGTEMARRLPLPAMLVAKGVGDSTESHALPAVWSPNVHNGRHDLSSDPQTTAYVVSGDVVGHRTEERASAVGLQRILGLRSYQTAWSWLHKLRRAMVRPGREPLSGEVEVDETYVGGVREGGGKRHLGHKALIAIAVETRGPTIGRIRLRSIPNATAPVLLSFVRDNVAPGSVLRTDGWPS